MASAFPGILQSDVPSRRFQIGAALFLVTALFIAMASVGQDRKELAGLIAMAALLGRAKMRLWPRLDRRLIEAPMAELIALVGCDGSGKSTLTADIRLAIGADRPVRQCYLGLGSGTIGERIKRLPLIGPVVERKLSKKAAQTRTAGAKIPGLPTALVIYAFSLARLRRFHRMLAWRRAGYVVVTDRYPQVECAGIYDGPGLSASVAGSWLVAALARQERRLYDYMAAFRPNIVIRLNIDAATALRRKPDHKADLLARKVAITPTLGFGGAPIVDLDATRTYDTVYAEAMRVAAGACAARPAFH